MARAGLEGFLEGLGLAERVFYLDKSKKNSDTLRIAKALGKEGYVAALVPHRTLRAQFLALASGAPVRVGFGRAFLTHRLPYVVDGRSEVERVLSLLGPLGVKPVGWRTLSPPEGALERSKALVEEDGFVAVAPGARWPTKRWLPSGWREVVLTLERRGERVVLLGTEQELLAEIAEGTRALNLAGKTDILTLFALISRAKAFLSGDTGPAHLAALASVPQVLIMGPTHPKLGFVPPNPRLRVVQVELPCRPCNPHGPKSCPLGHFRCMREITPGMVLEAFYEVAGSH